MLDAAEACSSVPWDQAELSELVHVYSMAGWMESDHPLQEPRSPREPRRLSTSKARKLIQNKVEMGVAASLGAGKVQPGGKPRVDKHRRLARYGGWRNWN